MTRRSNTDTESEEHLSAVDFRMPSGAELAAARAEWPNSAFVVMCLLGCFGAFGWALVFAAAQVLADYKTKAIESGAAHYNARTGDLEWNILTPPKPEKAIP